MSICCYLADKGDTVEFNLVGQTSGWVGIGFSTDNVMMRFSIHITTCPMINAVLDSPVAKK